VAAAFLGIFAQILDTSFEKIQNPKFKLKNEMNEGTYIFNVDFNLKFSGKEKFIDLLPFRLSQNKIYISSKVWPFSQQRQPKIRKTGRTSPIKARILSWNERTQILRFSLERYKTTEPNVKSYPVAWLHIVHFWVDSEQT
jgi:hypothetical protein